MPAKGGGGGGKPIHLTPAQEHAIDRALYQLARFAVEHGWSWWGLGTAALATGGWTAWYFWPEISEWLEQ